VSNFTPHGWHTVTPRIFTGDVAGLVGFLKAVFNATGQCRAGMPAEMRIGDSIVMISDGGGRRETMPGFLYVYVEDADETYRRAVDRRLKAMRETAASSVEAAGLYRTVGVPVVEGLAAFHHDAMPRR